MHDAMACAHSISHKFEMNEQIRKAQLYSRIFHIVFAILNLLATCFIVFYFFVQFYGEGNDYLIVSAVFLVIGLFLSLFHVVVALVLGKRTKFVYYLNFIAIVIECSGLLALIPAILIAAQWLKPEVKDYYSNAR